jgi:uncharacterized protein YjbI with pentapeptide repeats
MDREQFDEVARFVGSRQTRRAALAGLLGAALLGHAHTPAAAKLLAKRKRGGKKRNRGKKPGGGDKCYPGTSCIPGPGRDNAGCDFSNATRFFEGDFRGSHFGGANFSGAQLAGARLHGADLGGACFVKANLLDAELDGADLDGAIFCRTLMPDGSVNDRDCDRGTACCPTPTVCQGEACGPEDCVPNGNICTLLWFGNSCCSDQVCTPGIIPLVTSCQLPCSNQQECLALDPGGTLVCANNAETCTFIGTCCTEKSCESDADCPPPTTCGGAICQWDVS